MKTKEQIFGIEENKFWRCFELATKVILIEDKKLLEELAKR
jgi:hypothetical protein